LNKYLYVCIIQFNIWFVYILFGHFEYLGIKMHTWFIRWTVLEKVRYKVENRQNGWSHPPTQIFYNVFFLNAQTKILFWLQIRNHRKISRRMVCMNIWCILNLSIFGIFPTYSRLRKYRIWNTVSLENVGKFKGIIYLYTPFEAKFYADFEFEVKIIFLLTHFREKRVQKLFDVWFI